MKTGSTLTIQKAFANKLDDEALTSLRHVAKKRSYPARTILCQQGSIEHTFYIIVEGRVITTQQLEDGQERVLSMLGPYEYFGEMALIDDSPRMATCMTVVPTTVLEITEEVFDDLVQHSPVLTHALTKRILASMRKLDQIALAELREKNEALAQAYRDLKAAQDEVIEKKRIERELELAADVQRSLLPPSLPDLEDYAFVAHLEPARQVGGDFFDVVELDDERIGLLIADVADKGFHAALFMAVTRTLFRTEALNSLQPADVALAVHRGMLDIARGSDVFVTAFYGVLHRPSGRLTYVRAGQDRPVLVRSGQRARSLPGYGRFLGMIPDLTLEEETIQLLPGDKLVLFSDGVPDSVNREGDQYGNKRLMKTLDACHALSAAELIDFLVQDIDHWSQDADPFDDLTLLVVEVKTPD